VLGLTRRKEACPSIEAAGIVPIVGDITQADEFIGTLKNCDAVVHALADPSDAGGSDEAALEAVRSAAVDGRVRRLLYTSGTWVHGRVDRAIDESTPIDPLPVVKWRATHEELALGLRSHGLETVILRSPTIYGRVRGIFGGWWREAREKKTITYPGDGSQRWATVHVDDVAEAFALALEHAKPGDTFVLADGSEHTVREMAEAAALASGATARPWPRERVIETLGPFGEALLTDLRVSAARARRELGWIPRHTSFVREAPELWTEWQAGLREAVN